MTFIFLNTRTLNFSGLPHYSRSLISRIGLEVALLSDFVCIDLCNLKYDSSRAACIEPHFDGRKLHATKLCFLFLKRIVFLYIDMWLWGDRLVTVNLISNTFLTLQPGKAILDTMTESCEILVPMERRSLLVLSKDARYKWMHSIRKEHIFGMRWAITLREASDEYRVSSK